MYQAIQTTLQRIEAQQNAAEVHGIICGYLCVRPANANSANSDQSWLHVVLGDIEAGNIVAEQGKSVLIKLKTWVLDQLNSADMQIDLLLPTDQESLATRVIALTEWCDGFCWASV
ncbi:UPF0149 family protein [Candidatus Venteria ishoeyi]|uniref:Uncharacterized protein n=1 Tax=Candidatus Venteria ishoeyi TaxID=1899563 RepID=A0A1H6FCY6_9GAMM|nr:UPF0149 family protein [Candidatus Venteria ishoeyi]SEH07251.1 Uncharacterised protein [Candidatus Venteria ishoeyi]